METSISSVSEAKSRVTRDQDRKSAESIMKKVTKSASSVESDQQPLTSVLVTS